LSEWAVDAEKMVSALRRLLLLGMPTGLFPPLIWALDDISA
jgi:hypothetical protein